MPCTFGSERRPQYMQTVFIFINAPNWVCAAFPEGGALSNICEFWTAISAFLVTDPIDLAIAWFGAYANAQGAVLLEPFCSVAPPEVEEIFPLEVAGALLSLVIPFSDTILAAELNRKIGLKVQADRWDMYCKCNQPPPIPPEPPNPNPPNPNPTPFPPNPSPPCPGDTFTIIGLVPWSGSNGIYQVEVCMTLPANAGWVYQQTGSGGWLVFNSTYCLPWAVPTGIGGDNSGYRPKPEFEGDISPFIFKVPNNVAPGQIFLQGSTFFDQNGVLNQNIPIFVPFQDGGGNLFMFRTIVWDSINVSCTYTCADVTFTPGPAPEPPLNACDLNELLCKPKHGCSVKAMSLNYSIDCSEETGKQWQYNYGVCAEESTAITRSLDCSDNEQSQTQILKLPPGGSGGGGLN